MTARPNRLVRRPNATYLQSRARSCLVVWVVIVFPSLPHRDHHRHSTSLHTHTHTTTSLHHHVQARCRCSPLPCGSCSCSTTSSCASSLGHHQGVPQLPTCSQPTQPCQYPHLQHWHWVWLTLAVMQRSWLVVIDTQTKPRNPNSCTNNYKSIRV
jgi:hypothetical protein